MTTKRLGHNPQLKGIKMTVGNRLRIEKWAHYPRAGIRGPFVVFTLTSTGGTSVEYVHTKESIGPFIASIQQIAAAPDGQTAVWHEMVAQAERPPE